MKKTSVIMALVFVLGHSSCKKNNDASQITLTPSTTQATLGQTVAVTLSASANASRWNVTPASATQTYSLTTSKGNYFTFSQAGVYTVSVNAKTIAYDSTKNQSLDSC